MCRALIIPASDIFRINRTQFRGARRNRCRGNRQRGGYLFISFFVFCLYSNPARRLHDVHNNCTITYIQHAHSGVNAFPRALCTRATMINIIIFLYNNILLDTTTHRRASSSLHLLKRAHRPAHGCHALRGNNNNKIYNTAYTTIIISTRRGGSPSISAVAIFISITLLEVQIKINKRNAISCFHFTQIVIVVVFFKFFFILSSLRQ